MRSYKKMDRKDFIEQLFIMFPKSYCEANASIWRKAYEDVIPINTDCKSLMRTVIAEYSGSAIPKPAWFTDKTEVIRATQAAREDFQKSNPITIKSIYAEVNGRIYEFGYDMRRESEEDAKMGIYNRFPNSNIIFKDKKSVYESYATGTGEIKSFNAI
jgi:hypothetical protein